MKHRTKFSGSILITTASETLCQSDQRVDYFVGELAEHLEKQSIVSFP